MTRTTITRNEWLRFSAFRRIYRWRYFRVTLAVMAACAVLAHNRIKAGWELICDTLGPRVATPYVVSSYNDGAPTLHFILGWSATESGFPRFARMIDHAYKQRLPGVRIMFYRWDDNVHDLIQKNFPTGPIVLAGFSYGGCKAVETCRQFMAENRQVDHLVLFDPVQYENAGWSRPNTTDFVLSPNVVEAVCYHRDAKGPSYSAPIRGTSATRYVNVVYGSDHGAQIFYEAAIAKIATALKGKSMVAAAATQPARP